MRDRDLVWVYETAASGVDRSCSLSNTASVTETFVAPGALRAARERKNLTLRGLAAAVGMSSGYLSDLEGGLKGGRPGIHARIAAALDVSVEEITYSTETHTLCLTCHGRGVVPVAPGTPAGAAA